MDRDKIYKTLKPLQGATTTYSKFCKLIEEPVRNSNSKKAHLKQICGAIAMVEDLGKGKLLIKEVYDP